MLGYIQVDRYRCIAMTTEWEFEILIKDKSVRTYRRPMNVRTFLLKQMAGEPAGFTIRVWPPPPHKRPAQYTGDQWLSQNLSQMYSRQMQERSRR